MSWIGCFGEECSSSQLQRVSDTTRVRKRNTTKMTKHNKNAAGKQQPGTEKTTLAADAVFPALPCPAARLLVHALRLSQLSDIGEACGGA